MFGLDILLTTPYSSISYGLLTDFHLFLNTRTQLDKIVIVTINQYNIFLNFLLLCLKSMIITLKKEKKNCKKI